MYYISWVGYGQEHNTWVNADELNCKALIETFWVNKKKRPDMFDEASSDLAFVDSESEGEEVRSSKYPPLRSSLSRRPYPPPPSTRIMSISVMVGWWYGVGKGFFYIFSSTVITVHKLPKPGDVDLLSGGPPCQGFR